MNTKIFTMGLSLLAGVCALAMPAVSHAGNVGYYGSCGGGSKPDVILAAGHTPVSVPGLTAGSLVGLDALILEPCNAYTTPNADINAAVAAGMLLILNDWNPGLSTALALPGSPAVVIQGDYASEVDLASSMPPLFANGPGGILTNASMDGGSASNHGYTATALPAGITALLTTGNPSHTISFMYQFGAGTVIYNAIPLDHYLVGGAWDESSLCTPTNICAGLRTYMINSLACTLDAECAPAPPTTLSCAEQGYKGMQLVWCKNICEKGYTGQKLQTWLHRWFNQYHTEPACMMEGDEGGEGGNGF